MYQNPYLQQQMGQPMATSVPQSGQPMMSLGSPSNPYLNSVVQSMQQQANQNLTRNLLPAIGRGAIAAGGYGGSRQGIAEGIALGDTQQGLTNATANLYGNAYGQDQNFYTQQRGQDLQQQQQGFNQFLQGLNANLAAGQTLYGMGQQMQQAPWTSMQNLMQILGPIMGQTGSSAVNQPSTGGGLAGALGGALGAAQLFNLMNKPGG